MTTTNAEAIKTLEKLRDNCNAFELHAGESESLTLAIESLKGEATRLPEAVKESLRNKFGQVSVIRWGDAYVAYHGSMLTKDCSTPEAAIDAIAKQLDAGGKT